MISSVLGLLVLAGAHASEEGEKLSIKVFIYDHESILKTMSGPDEFERTFRSYSTPTLGGLVERLKAGGERHFPDLELALGLRPALQKSPLFTVIDDDPGAADFVFISIYEDAVCFHNRLSKRREKDPNYELDDRIDLHSVLSCGRLWNPLLKSVKPQKGQSALWMFYSTLQKSARWQRHQGRDHVWVASKLHPWIFRHTLQPGQRESGNVSDSIVGPSRLAYKIALNAMFAAVEERRIPEQTGASTFFPLPYFVPKDDWWVEDITGKSTLVQMIAGTCQMHNHCPVCEELGFKDRSGKPGEPGELRGRIFFKLPSACQKQNQICEFRNLGGVMQENGKIKCGDKEKIDRHEGYTALQARVKDSMERSVFCIVPRGDSAASRRFYNAIIKLCIPVVISNAFPFPFHLNVNYSRFVIQVPEQQAYDDVDGLLETLTSLSPQAVLEAQNEMRKAREDLLYEGNAMQLLLDAFHSRFAYMLHVRFDVNDEAWKEGGLSRRDVQEHGALGVRHRLFG